MNPKREELLVGIGKEVVSESEFVGGGSRGRKESPQFIN